MRLAALLLGALIAFGAAAQEPVKKKTKSQASAKAHKKPTPAQIRKFNELEKKKKQ